jgi:signal transduction histidine kinase/PAS domain-containing protein/ActR/RegA family two-component response regulator
MWMKPPPKAFTPYLLTLAATAAAIGARWLLTPWIGDQLPLVTLVAAVAAGVWLGGFRTALLAMATGYLACDTLFPGARVAAGMHGTRDPAGLGAFVLSSAIIIGFGECVRAARTRERATLHEAQRLSHLGSWRWTEATGRTLVSDELRRIFGLPEDAGIPALKDQDGTLYPHDSWLRLDAAVKEAMRTGRGFHLDLEALRGAGSGAAAGAAAERIWVSMRSEAIQDAQGRMIGLRGTVQEITERKRAEALMEGQRRILEKIARRVPLHGVLDDLARTVEEQDPGLLCSIHLIDEDGTRLLAGAGPSLPAEYMRAMDGAPIEPPEAGPCCLVAQAQKDVLVPDIAVDRHWSARWREQALKAGLRSVRSTVVRGAGGVPLATFAMYRRHPGNPEPANVQVGFVARQLAAIAIERERADADLRQAEADARLLQTIGAELLSDRGEQSIYDKIVEGAARLMRSQCSSLQAIETGGDGGLELRLLASLGFNERGRTHWERVRLGGPTTCGKSLASGARSIVPDVESCPFMDGTEDLAMSRENGIVAVQTTPLVTRAGNMVGMLSTHWNRTYIPPERDLRTLDILARQAADLIERKRHDDALREADRRKDEFLATLAHELRNPLAPMRNSLATMRLAGTVADRIEEPGRPREVMERQLQHLIRLVDDLLDVSRITRGTMQLRREPVDLGSVLQHALETCRPLVEGRRQEVTVGLPDQAIWLNADPVRLAQVFNNLLNNASKYTEPGGHVWLTAERQGDEALVRVRDTGLGIPPDRLSSIFEMFSQVDRSLERAQGGLGVGLSLVKRMVELHGGSILAHSEGPGRGSEFVVRLPVLRTVSESGRPARPRADRPAPAPHAGNGRPGRRALVVDDNIDSADSLAMLLRVTGHEAVTAHDGVEALAVAERVQPEVIFLDIGMPRLNGYEAARRIREAPWGRDMLLVAMTGWGKDEDRRRSREAGFDAHLVKPADCNELLKLMESLAPARGRSARDT